jgi:hypothetical protein
MRALKAVSVAVLAIALTGCLQSFVLIRVNKDGSGTLEETVVLSNAFTEMLKGFGGEGALPPTSKEELAQRAATMGEGVRLLSSEEVVTDSGSGYKAVFAFDDINTLQVNQNPGENVPATPSPSGEGSQAPAQEWLHFRFTKGSTPTLEVFYPKEVEEPNTEELQETQQAQEELESDEQMMQMMRQLYKDMRLGMAVEVQGKIVDTNASYVEGSRVTLMDVDFGLLMKDEKKFQQLLAAQPDTVEEMKQLIKDNPAIRVETREKVSIRFR